MARKLLGFFALFAVLAAGSIAVRAVAAQGHGGMMSMMKDCPMMGAMTSGPEAALRHDTELGLSAEQVQRLEAIRTGAPDHGTMMERMQGIHAQMNAIAEGATFDEAAARDAFEQMNALHTEIGVAMLRNRHAVRQVLTPEQSEKLAALAAGGMMGGRHGMMEDCPMMKGGMMGGHPMMQEGRDHD
jgi:Spy/CpxP family protein refolding chaperone